MKFNCNCTPILVNLRQLKFQNRVNICLAWRLRWRSSPSTFSAAPQSSSMQKCLKYSATPLIGKSSSVRVNKNWATYSIWRGINFEHRYASLMPSLWHFRYSSIFGPCRLLPNNFSSGISFNPTACCNPLAFSVTKLSGYLPSFLLPFRLFQLLSLISVFSSQDSNA